MSRISAFLTGIMFGFGLLIAGMANPARVLGFLDVTGTWDPALVFTMIGGIGVAAVGFALARRLPAPLLEATFNGPTARQIDRRLVGGSVLFGVGWGLAGICPGPGLVLVGALKLEGVLFVSAMVAGMALYELLQSPTKAA